MTKLAKIAERVVNQTGIYHSQRPYYWQTVDSDKSSRKRFQGKESINGCKQVSNFLILRTLDLGFRQVCQKNISMERIHRWLQTWKIFWD